MSASSRRRSPTLSHVPRGRVASLVRTGREAALRSVYVKAGLPQIAFDGFMAAIETWNRRTADGAPSDRYRFTREMVDAVLARYEQITDGEMNELTTMLRRFAVDQAREAARDLRSLDRWWPPNSGIARRGSVRPRNGRDRT